MEQNAMEIVNDNALDDKSDVEMEHLIEKSKEEKQESLVSLNELTEYCNTKNESQEINEDNNFDKSNTNIVLGTQIKNLNEFVSCADVIQLQQLKSGPSYEDTSETTIIPELNNFFGQELEPEQYFKLISKQTESFDLSCDENNINLPSFSDSHCTDSFSCSLYSNNISSPSSPSCISYMSSLPGTSNENSEYSLTKEDLLFSYFEKISHDNLDPMSESNEVIETKDVEHFETELLIKSNHTNDTLEKKNLIEFDLLQYVLENVKLEDNNEVQKNSECFVEDRIIINPDIMYNIELKLHLKKMQLLAEKISKTPDDLTVLNKCKELISIPEMKHKRQIVTEKYKPFPEDISESNCYNIQRKDWNEIIISQAAVLSDVGFDFTSKDILYLLRDEAINYIKRLVGIMKNNFDIQSKSSSPNSIDPILNSLKEIGVKDGMEELIKHYKNDVLDRRNRLLKECEHFQTTIDQFVKHSLLTSTIKNKNKTQESIVEEQSTSKINVTKENVEEKASTSIEINHSESGNIDNINTASKKSECIKTNIDDVYNKKMYYTKCSNTDVQINDLLKCSHMITIPSNCKSNSFTSKKSFLSTNNLCKQKEKSSNLLKNKKLFDMLKSDNIFDATESKINIDKVKIQSTSTSNTVIPNSVKSIGLDHASFQKVIDEFNKNFDHESVYGNRSTTQNIPVYNEPDVDDAMNEGNYSDYPNRE